MKAQIIATRSAKTPATQSRYASQVLKPLHPNRQFHFGQQVLMHTAGSTTRIRTFDSYTVRGWRFDAESNAYIYAIEKYGTEGFIWVEGSKLKAQSQP